MKVGTREGFSKYQLVVGLSFVCFLHVLNDVVKEFLNLGAKIWWIFENEQYSGAAMLRLEKLKGTRKLLTIEVDRYQIITSTTSKLSRLCS